MRSGETSRNIYDLAPRIVVLLQLDDAKREMDLTIETRVQESLVNVRPKGKLEAEESLKLKVASAKTLRR